MTRRPKRAGLFRGWWFEPAIEYVDDEPKRILIRKQRVSRKDLATAYRLWAKHSDVRTGKAQ